MAQNAIPMPAPWSVKRGEIWSDPAGEIVGVVYRTEAWTEGEPIETEDQANAALIAAAPDLLAALKRLIAAIEDIEFDGNATNECDAARVAIAKVEGA